MRFSTSKKLALAGLFTAALIALTSCGIGSPNTSKTSDAAGVQKTIVVGTRVVAETLDPSQASNANNDFFIAGMYDRVVRYNAEGKLEPGIAKKWSYSGDARTLKLTLRDDAKFHSGNLVTADDVVYTLERLKGLASGSAGYIADMQSAKADGKDTVNVALKNPNLNFIGALSLIYVLDSKLVKDHEAGDNAQQWLSSNDAGSGPYMLSDYSANQKVTLKRFDDYWGGSDGRPSELVLRMITEPSAIRDEFKAGNINVAYGVPSIDLKSFDSDANADVVSLPSTRVTYGIMNMQGKVTGNEQVREAIQLAYDYKGHVATALGGYGGQADGLLPTSMQCRVSTGKTVQDMDKAKKLVKEAGVEGANLTIAYQPVIPEQKVAGTILEASLREIGFTVTVKPITFSQYLDMVSKPETTPDVAILWDFAPYPAPAPMLQHTWSSSTIGQSNFARYSNPNVDELLNTSRSATNPDQGCSTVKDAQTKILGDRPAILMAYPAIVLVQDKQLQKVEYDPVSPTFDVTLLKLAK